MVGISQRPADVKKDYITQCDWLVWHRLTWNNDTKVVRRILDGQYADAVEDLNDGEAFMMTDWSESVRRVQFHRKQTFDAGATPGLDDFERPELKSVSDDLVSELQSISEEKQQRDSTIEELREELDTKNSRIAELERELQDAQDLSRMADQFVDAMLDQVDGASPGRTETERMRARRQRREGQSPNVSKPDEGTLPPAETKATTEGDSTAADTGFGDGDGFPVMDDEALAEAADAFGAVMDDEDETAGDEDETVGDDSEIEGGFPSFEEPEDMPSLGEEQESALEFSAADSPAFGFQTPDEMSGDGTSTNGVSTNDASTNGAATNGASRNGGSRGGGSATTIGAVDADLDGSDDEAIAAAVSAVDASETPEVDRPTPAAVDSLRGEIRSLDEKTRRMLAYYDEQGPATPLDAHFVAGGTGDRTNAYAHNRALRTAGLIEHVGRGTYDVCIRERLDEATDGRLDEDDLAAFRAQLAAEFGR
jgi:TolA-binding protein